MFCKFCNASLQVECITARALRLCGRPYWYAAEYYIGGKDGYKCLFYVCSTSLHVWVVDCLISVTGPRLHDAMHSFAFACIEKVYRTAHTT